MTFSDLGKSLEEPLGQASTWMGNNITRRHITIASSVLAALCLLSALVYALMPEEKSSYGAVRIEGILTLDGKPVVGASVILHPRDDESGHAARGATNERGRFRVTTGSDPIGRGAVPGKYDVTFLKRGEISGKYENVKTSGLDFITVEPSGKNRFNFELSSGDSPRQPVVSTGIVSSSSSPSETPPIREPEIIQPPSFPDIWAAVTRGTVEDVVFFIESGVSVNSRNNVGNAPLHLAAQSNPSVAVLQYLIDQNADVRVRNTAGQTPLDVANTDAKRNVLLAAGATPTPPAPQAPLFQNIWEAAARGTPQDVQALVSTGANVNEADNNSNTPLHLAAQSNPNVAVLQYLVAQRADVNAKNNVGDTPLHLAARSNPNVAVLRFFVNPRVNLNAINNAHQTPLEVVGNPQQQKREILQRVPHPSSIPNIFEAATRGTVEDVAYYVSRTPASVNERDNIVNTPLHLAARNNPNVEVLRYLIARGADANARDYNGNTPLHLAARSNSSAEVLRFLISQSENTNAVNGAGRTPLDDAMAENGPILMLEGGRSGRQL